jgi:hypothetical protein
MIPTYKKLIAGLIVSVICGLGTAQADTVFSNFLSCTPGSFFCTTTAPGITASGAGDVIGNATGIGSNGVALGPSGTVAEAFISQGNFTLNSLLLPIYTPLILNSRTNTLAPGVNSIDITLYADNHGSPGTALETWALSGAIPCPYTGGPTGCFRGESGVDGSLVPPLNVTSASHPLLTGGSQYWVAAGIADPSTYVSWLLATTSQCQTAGHCSNDVGGTNAYGTFPLGAPWTVNTSATCCALALEVNGTAVPVPEPATVGLMALGLLGAGFAGRKRRD